MRLVKRSFNNPSNLFPTLWNNLFADDNYIKHSLEQEEARQEAIKRWYNNSDVAVNVKNLDDAFVIELAAPGYDKSDFKIEFEKDRLLISAAKTQTEEATVENFTHKEFAYSSFERAFNLLEDSIDVNAINASYKAGILTVRVPKKEAEYKKRNIDVQ